jgi:hypothetical protein
MDNKSDLPPQYAQGHPPPAYPPQQGYAAQGYPPQGTSVPVGYPAQGYSAAPYPGGAYGAQSQPQPQVCVLELFFT